MTASAKQRGVHRREVGDDECILVVLARASHVGFAEDVDDDLAAILWVIVGHEKQVRVKAKKLGSGS